MELNNDTKDVYLAATPPTSLSNFKLENTVSKNDT